MTGQNAAQRVANGATNAFRSVSRLPNKIRLAIRDFQESKAETAAIAKGPDAEARQSTLLGFYTDYEFLVELLCDAAQYGPDSRLEQRYESLRNALMTSYPELRQYVIAYLKVEVSDARRSMDWLGSGADAFETLWAAPTLAELLRQDDGEMIWRIERTRTALNLYADHLRELAAHERVCG